MSSLDCTRCELPELIRGCQSVHTCGFLLTGSFPGWQHKVIVAGQLIGKHAIEENVTGIYVAICNHIEQLFSDYEGTSMLAKF